MNRRECMATMAAAATSTWLQKGQAAADSPQQTNASERGAVASDPRNIRNGFTILENGYCDQPYVEITKDGNWVSVVTTGTGREGVGGQHVVATISGDKGRTWSPPIDIEPATGPEASWAMPFVTPGGRLYAFYTYNAANIRKVPNCNSPGAARRVDTLGEYACKYSDDNGRTWSRERYSIPMRKMRIDETNNFNGKVLLFWGVGRPVRYRSSMIFGFTKVGKWGEPGTLVTTQGVFMRSDNILHEPDPRNLEWQMLPDGDEGLRAPKGPIASEANLVPMNDGALYCTYRTIDGYNCHAYSRDGGHTWTPPAYATYTPNGRRIKHPRAANFVHKFSNGKYLLWFHNHGGEAIWEGPWSPYAGRNPGWICGGVEKGGHIHWSQPEILLYDEELSHGISYPDFVEDHGRYFITETQKDRARVHEIDPELLEGVWNQSANKRVAKRGLVLEATGSQVTPASAITMPRLGPLSKGTGFTIDLWVKFSELSPGQVLFDALDRAKGISLAMSNRATIQLTMNDGKNEFSWDSDSGTTAGTLKVGVWQHVAVTVDSGPGVVSFIVDGELNDGGAIREYGWARFPAELDDINGASSAKIAPRLYGEVRLLRIYNRYLRTSEVVGNFRAGA